MRLASNIRFRTLILNASKYLLNPPNTKNSSRCLLFVIGGRDQCSSNYDITQLSTAKSCKIYTVKHDPSDRVKHTESSHVAR